MKNSNKTIQVKNTAGDIFGYQLTADFTAEHEWGIEELLKLFGLDGDGYGVDVRTNIDSNNLHILEVDKGFILLAQDTYRDTQFKADFLMSKMSNSSMWDGSNFAIFSETRDIFDMLVEAEKNNDLAVGLFGDFSKLAADKGVYVIVNTLNE